MVANIGTYTISDAGQELEAMMHGTSLNDVQNLYGVYNRVARRLLGDVDPQETKVVSQFGKVYDGVWDYALAVDVKGNKIIDLFPQANRQLSDTFSQLYNKEFDLWKNFSLVPDFTPRYSNATRTVRINAIELNTGISINQANAYNGNGTFVAGTNVSSVATNNQLTTDGGSGSVQFTINQTGVNPSTAVITNTTGSAVDLTTHFNNADEFFSFYIPTASGMTSIRYQFGTNSSNYYDSGAITTDMMGNAFVNGWNTVKVPFSSFTTVGTPTVSSVGQFLQITIIYNGTVQTQVLLNQFWSRLGVIFNQEYYSKYLFRDGTTGTFKEKVTSDSDILNLDTDGYNGFIYASQAEIAQQQQGIDALFFDANQSEQRYQTWLTGYRAKYKSEITKPQTSYYKPRAQGYRTYIGRGYWTP